MRGWLKGKSALGVRTFLALAEQLLRALDAVHDCGVVHRDLKPDNILVRFREGQKDADGYEQPEAVKLADFGLGLVHSLPEPE